MAILKIKPADSPEIHEFQLPDERISLGRAQDNRIILNDKTASRHHAEIHKAPQGFLLSDTGSANGTWVNRKKVEQHLLSDGDEIRIAGTTIIFADPPSEAATVLLDVASFRDGVDDDSAPHREPTAPFLTEDPVIPQEPRPPGPAFKQPQAAVPPMAVSPPPPPMQMTPPPYQQAAAPVAAASGAVFGEKAGFGIRLGAYLIDSIVLTLIMMVIMIPLGIGAAALAQKSQGAVLALSAVGWILGFGAAIAYILVPWARSGATLGKKILKLKVIREDGVEPLGYGKAALRLLGYMASGAIFYIGFLMVLFNDDKKGLHDMIAGTLVVRT